ncbi:tetratricopeptide repeat protein [bacterium]|nr:tetratricopeptide repeat protein [bacterium]MBU1064934.1 tetratricopeptide repeat protein [bacterium]MBU1633817.1 tetratricopeptide repeat protein [bacterium]MBU1872904.1 tetratricopeptide repeat protein [bacterium]
MIKRGYILIVICVMLTVSLSGQITRVAFTKPGFMMKIPTSSIYRTPYIFRTGISTDIYGFVDTLITRGVFFETDLSNTFKIGVTSIQGLGASPPVEFGLHFQKRLFVYGDISFSAGVHDLVLKQGDKELNIDTKTLSIFGVISNEKQFENSNLFTYMGFGTGGLATGFGSDSATSAGVFAGVLLHTSILADRGGIEFIGEFDGGGVNAGVRIPFTKDYNLTLGVNNLVKLYNFAAEDFNLASVGDYPSLNIGLDFRIPRVKPESARRRRLEGMVDEETQMILDMEEQFATKLDSTLKAADYEIAKLKDSLKVYESEIKYLTSEVAQLRQKTAVLEDSVRSAKLAKHAMEQNINLALKHLSRSLRYFYAGDYREALQEVEASIDLNSNLALAYARRGSIYYKLGDIDRATINWNLALRIDPEYDDVRNILRALNENRLRSTGSTQKE